MNNFLNKFELALYYFKKSHFIVTLNPQIYQILANLIKKVDFFF